MKDKKQIIIDGVNIRKCPYLYIDPKTGAIWCTERRFGGCQVMPNCRFKEVTRLKRERKIERIRNTRLSKKIAKELVKQDRYRKALEEIEEYINQYEMLGKLNIKYILNIINKAKGEGDE